MNGKALSTLVVMAALSACSSTPSPPDWQMNARGALDAFTNAYMTGNTRVEVAEFSRARSALAATGQPELVARAELLRCAAQVASLVLQPCDGFEPLRQDAPAAERAYAAWLAGQAQPADAALLPAAQRAVLSGGAEAVKGIADPLSRLVAAGVLMRMGRATPEVLALAVDTASAQGWRRPLLAWLGVQAQRAEAAGAADEAARIRRRMALVAP
ncbi:MAG: hypothetical protein LCH79_08215 [Proteobacteria bacterium]|jgi:hypothetical protein|nr:hypothetical protein [Pseudomonadota bacterium]